MMIYKKKSGFTLIELMIVVAIIGILGAIAYPSYVDSIRKGRRSDAHDALTMAMQKLEVFKSNNAAYPGALADANILVDSTEKYYALEISNGCAAPCISLLAKPTTKNGQNNDHVSQYELFSTGFKRATYDGTVYPSWTNFH